MGTAEDIPRAEYPPARYWRRWCADADPPTLPQTEADAVEAATAVAAPSGPVAVATAAADGDAAYRVLIVEDDRSQALFAQSVLAGAGMQAQAESNPEEVMAALETFRPDLVLMDLHMPAIDGAELTDMIRSHPQLAHTPIVFLTGDPDPERQFEVLQIGADDFLSKPVRPRHLITAVENRIRRSRQLQAQQPPDEEGADPATGLLPRNRMFQRLASAIPGEGAVHFVEIEGIAALRGRLGYTALETVLAEAGRQVAALAEGHATARLNDNTFLIHVAEASADTAAFARRLRDGLARHALPGLGEGETLRLRASIGSADITPAFDNAGSALAAAEEALRAARADPTGIARYVQPPPEAQAPPGLAEQVAGAVAQGRLELAYQPIVAVAGGDEAQYQTLLRLRDSEGTLHPAGRILPVAESAGLLQQIDHQVLALALGVLQRQQQRKAPVRLFVSQSPRSLSGEDYAEWVVQTMEAAQIDGAMLVIDVRQDDALIHALSLQEFGAKMVPAGVQLCLSQYRPGDEVDALLAQLPLSFVRLAADFSSKLDDSEVRDRMRAAIERAHRHGLQVIGQQVEDPQAAATLWMSGIDYIQGNLVQQAAGELDFDFHHSVL